MDTTPRMFGLDARVALVTGGSRGIGRACAEALARQGAHVVIGYQRNETAAAATLDAIKARGGNGELMRFDVADEADTQATVQALAKRLGRLDLLIANAGITGSEQLLVRQPMADIERVLRANLLGAMHCCKSVLPSMMKRRYGRIVCLSSVVASTGNLGQAAYAASKAGLEGFVRSVAREYGSRGITVNAVAPGLIATDMTAHLGQAAFDAAATQLPAGRVGQPADVAALIAFLCSDEAGYVTGQVLAVNGGMRM